MKEKGEIPPWEAPSYPDFGTAALGYWFLNSK